MRRFARLGVSNQISHGRGSYDLDRVAQRVSEVFSKGRQKGKVKARSLLFFWASRELGMSYTVLARRLEMSLAGIGFSVERGASIAREENYSLET